MMLVCLNGSLLPFFNIHSWCQVCDRIMPPAQRRLHAAAPLPLCSPYAGVVPTVTRSLTVTALRTKRTSSAPCPHDVIASLPRPWAHPGAFLPPTPTMVRNTAADSGHHAQEHPDDLFRAPVQSFLNLPRVKVGYRQL